MTHRIMVYVENEHFEALWIKLSHLVQDTPFVYKLSPPRKTRNQKDTDANQTQSRP